MKYKFIFICLATLPFILSGNLLYAELEVGPSDDRYEQEADEAADTVIKRPRPDIMPDPTGKIGEGIYTKTIGGDSRSMGRVPGATPGGPVIRPGAMLKSQSVRSEGRLPGVGPVGPAQQGVKGAGSVMFDGVEGEVSPDPPPKKTSAKFDGVDGEAIGYEGIDGEAKGPAIGQKQGMSMPIDPLEGKKMPIDPYGSQKMPTDPLGHQ